MIKTWFPIFHAEKQQSRSLQCPASNFAVLNLESRVDAIAFLDRAERSGTLSYSFLFNVGNF